MPGAAYDRVLVENYLDSNVYIYSNFQKRYSAVAMLGMV